MNWETNKEYKVGDMVYVYQQQYECLVDHKSNVFGNDLFDKRFWKRVIKV